MYEPIAYRDTEDYFYLDPHGIYSVFDVLNNALKNPFNMLCKNLQPKKSLENFLYFFFVY